MDRDILKKTVNKKGPSISHTNYEQNEMRWIASEKINDLHSTRSLNTEY